MLPEKKGCRFQLIQDSEPGDLKSGNVTKTILKLQKLTNLKRKLIWSSVKLTFELITRYLLR